jgi:hypothetical protein
LHLLRPPIDRQILWKSRKSPDKRIWKIKAHNKKSRDILSKLSNEEQVWMSHGDAVTGLDKDFEILASTASCPIAVIENKKQKLYGVHSIQKSFTLSKEADSKKFHFRYLQCKKRFQYCRHEK